MQLPLITSVWRSLAGIENGLESAWGAVRPIMLSGEPERALQELREAGRFPAPGTSATEQLQIYELKPVDISPALTVIDAYNRSNGMNHFALSMLLTGSNRQPADKVAGASEQFWPELPRLLEKDEIDAATWVLLEQVRFLGATEESPVIATLWRHLAHWPGLLRLVIDSYEPMNQDGSLQDAIAKNHEQVTRIVAESSAPAAHLSDIPEEALGMIKNYAQNPGAVNRMVCIGHGVREWLGSSS